MKIYEQIYTPMPCDNLHLFPAISYANINPMKWNDIDLKAGKPKGLLS